MLSVGYATWNTSPPRKNGEVFCRSGEIISMRHTSCASGGMVTMSWSRIHFTASNSRSRTMFTCSPGGT